MGILFAEDRFRIIGACFERYKPNDLKATFSTDEPQ